MIGQPNDLDEARELLADACRVLYRLGLVDYMGHPSIRIPGSDLILIKPRHSTRIGAQDAIPPERMAVIDLDGRLIAGTDPPPGERFIHTAIYRARPDVGAIVHTHQPMATVMGIAGERSSRFCTSVGAGVHTGFRSGSARNSSPTPSSARTWPKPLVRIASAIFAATESSAWPNPCPRP